MKKLYTLFFIIVLLVLGNCVFGQQAAEETLKSQPKDSLPDLWIVTMDVSKSMLDTRLASVPQQLGTMMRSFGVKENEDSFVLLLSGADKNRLLARNGYPVKGTAHASSYGTNLVSDLVRRSAFANDFNDLIARVRNICSSRDPFQYDMSFTSLVRPLSIYELASIENYDFSQYRKIYHILITDDGDANDQWMMDYKWMKKWAPKNFAIYNELLPTIACSEFDFTSRQAGKFIELNTLSSTQPRIYLTEYVTYQNNNPERKLPVDSLVEVSDFHDNAISFRLNCADTSVVFAYISSFRINGHEIQIGQYLYPGDEFQASYDKSYGKALRNSISLAGHYQENYQDRILNARPRTVGFEGELPYHFVNAETKAMGKKILEAAIILLLLMTLFISVWRNMIVLRIYVNGKCWSIKRKAMNRLKYSEYTLVTAECGDEGLKNVFFYKDNGIYVTDNKSITKQGQNLLVVKTWRMGSLSRHDTTNVLPAFESPQKMMFTEGFKNGRSIQFSYSARLAHTLIIRFEVQQMNKRVEKANALEQRNLEMLASYYEKHADEIASARNNVVVNIIDKTDLNSIQYHYAVLNIFDTHSQSSANRIFLRYSLMCFFSDSTTKETVTKQLLQVASRVLKNEKQRIGHVAPKPNIAYSDTGSSVCVDVSPMLSYLFLLKKGTTRMVYSPFADGCLDLSSKRIRLFPQTGMILKNTPVGYRTPVYRDEKGFHDPTMIEYRSQNHKFGTLSFQGSDAVSLLKEEKDFSYGHQESCAHGITYYSLSMDGLKELNN